MVFIPKLPKVNRLSPGVYRRESDGALIPGPNATPIRGANKPPRDSVVTTQPVTDVGGVAPNASTPAVTKPQFVTSQYGARINVAGLNQQQIAKITQLANSKYGTKAQQLAQTMRGRIPKVTTPATTPVTPVETAPPAVSTTPATTTPVNNSGNMETLFPSTRMFEPKNYEGSPLYQFQVKSGMDQLTKSLAARGLYNSGKAIQDEINIPLQAAAQDTDRMTRVASENADRLKSFQDNEALRLERAGNAQWDRQFNLASLMAQQSPWAASLAGLNNTADLTKQSGDAQANYLRDAYNRIIASPGGGGRRGGGSGTAATPIPVPTGPDYSNITPTQIGGDYSSNKGWLNILTGLAGSLF